MRELTGHVVNPANDKIKIEVLDEPGAGGANHFYLITGVDWSKNPLLNQKPGVGLLPPGPILFQNGTIPEAGVNGVTHEVLLEIVADRLRSFHKGPFASKANACALTHIEEAMHWLHSRTLERMRRGVEGTHTV